MANISLIAAMDNNGIIGKDQRIPWHLPADLKHFKQITLDKPIIMGRHTFESIGKALPQRDNIVVTRNLNWTANGVRVAHDLTEAFEMADNSDEIIIIGGSALYAAALPLATRLYLTYVDAAVEGDTYFPDWDKNAWREVLREQHSADKANPYAYCFATYERV